VLGVAVFLSNGDGTFNQAALLLPGQNTVSAAVADFNNDGLPDIVSTSADVTSILINAALHVDSVDSVVNAASFAANQPVAPGSLVAIFGAGIGPAAGAVPSGPSADTLAGVSVTFNGIPAPLLYVSARQINAQVPWEISGDADVLFNKLLEWPYGMPILRRTKIKTGTVRSITIAV
jgi:FG-GAP-like repeat